MTWSELVVPLVCALIIPYVIWVIRILIRDHRAQKAREKREREERDARTQAAWDQIYKERAERDAELVSERARRFIRPSALSRAITTSTRTNVAKVPERKKQKSHGSSSPSIDVDFSSGSDSGGGGE